MAYGFPPTQFPNNNQTNGFHLAIKTPSLATNQSTTTASTASHGFPPTRLSLNLTKYVNDTDGISVIVPQGWGVEAGQNQANATTPLVAIRVTPPLSKDPSALANVYIYKDTQPTANNSVSQYLRDSVDIYRSNDDSFKLGYASTNINVTGRPGYQLQYSYRDSDSTLLQALEVGALLRGNGYYVHYEAPPNLFNILLPQVNLIVQSLKVNPPTLASPNNNFATPSNITAPQHPSNMTAASSPNNLSALVDKGNALYQQGNFTQAIQYYDKALAIDPKDEHALDGKGEALSNQGDYTQAIKNFNMALAIDPNDKEALDGKQIAISKLNQIPSGNMTTGNKTITNALKGLGNLLTGKMTALPQSSSAPAQNFVTYVNNKYNISVQYPSDWTIKEWDDSDQKGGLGSDQKNIVTIMPPKATDSSGNVHNYFAINIDRNPDSDLSTYLSDQEPDYLDGFKLSESNTNAILAGQPAYTMTYTDSDTYDSKAMEIGTIYGGKGFFVDYQADPGVFDTYLPTIYKMLSSFKTSFGQGGAVQSHSHIHALNIPFS